MKNFEVTKGLKVVVKEENSSVSEFEAAREAKEQALTNLIECTLRYNRIWNGMVEEDGDNDYKPVKVYDMVKEELKQLEDLDLEPDYFKIDEQTEQIASAVKDYIKRGKFNAIRQFEFDNISSLIEEELYDFAYENLKFRSDDKFTLTVNEIGKRVVFIGCEQFEQLYKKFYAEVLSTNENVVVYFKKMAKVYIPQMFFYDFLRETARKRFVKLDIEAPEHIIGYKVDFALTCGHKSNFKY